MGSHKDTAGRGGVIGTTGSQQVEGHRNHRVTAGRGPYKPQGHSRQRVIGTTGTQ